MHRILFFLVLCCFWQPAFACNEAEYKEGQKYSNSDPTMLDSATIFGADGKLEPLFTRCYKDDECVYVAQGCGGAQAVNRMSAQIVNHVLGEISAHVDCVMSGPIAPLAVKCISNMCKAVPNDSK